MLLDKRKIVVEEFPKQKEFMPKLAGILNALFSDISRILTKNITFKENIAGEVLTVTIDGVFPLDIKWPNKSLPMAAWIGRCYETSGKHANFGTPLFLDWEMKSNSEFRINNITGLTATNSNPFSVTIISIIG